MGYTHYFTFNRAPTAAEFKAIYERVQELVMYVGTSHMADLGAVSFLGDELRFGGLTLVKPPRKQETLVFYVKCDSDTESDAFVVAAAGVMKNSMGLDFEHSSDDNGERRRESHGQRPKAL
jgi:hypothetical protein